VRHYASKPVEFIDVMISDMRKLANDMGIELGES
jgi:hypothetical protein